MDDLTELASPWQRNKQQLWLFRCSLVLIEQNWNALSHIHGLTLAPINNGWYCLGIYSRTEPTGAAENQLWLSVWLKHTNLNSPACKSSVTEMKLNWGNSEGCSTVACWLRILCKSGQSVTFRAAFTGESCMKVMQDWDQNGRFRWVCLQSGAKPGPTPVMSLCL